MKPQTERPPAASNPVTPSAETVIGIHACFLRVGSQGGALRYMWHPLSESIKHTSLTSDGAAVLGRREELHSRADGAAAWAVPRLEHKPRCLGRRLVPGEFALRVDLRDVGVACAQVLEAVHLVLNTWGRGGVGAELGAVRGSHGRQRIARSKTGTGAWAGGWRSVRERLRAVTSGYGQRASGRGVSV